MLSHKWKKFLPLLLSLIFIGLLGLIVARIKKAGYHVIFTATASVPKGFYLITPLKTIERHDIVEFIPPSNILSFIKDKHWIPHRGTLIKYVFAKPHDHVCIYHRVIWINGKKIAKVYKFYAKNKLLPQIQICGKLQKNEYLLLSTKSERSFDSRYFGIVTRQEILGRAIPIFTYDT
ncbi:MAG: signal peptidase I [Coxiellaceae bacterium]|jgi:conjugative transfer signal peptidase TraF|nr:signal peptidase I [Coxiellaceae bacterium]